MAAITQVLRRKLGLFDVLCIGINAIVGSGVFSLPDDMQREMGGWSPFAFALCALLLLPVALCFAELSGAHEETGGSYIYARNAFGREVGFVVGWFCWLSTFVSWAANTTLLVDLLGFQTWPLNKVVVVAVICSLGAVNYFGVKPGAWLINAMVIGKLTAIFCFLAVAVMAFDPEPLGGALPRGVAGVGQGVYLALFPLQGFEVTPVAAGETDNPKRNVPLATMGALLFSAVLFIAVQSTLVGVYPKLGEKESYTPLLDASRYLGPTLGVVVLVGSLVSMGGFTAGSALGAPRYAQAIAQNGLLPSPVAKTHPRFHTPHVAIVVTTVITAVLGAFFDYRRLVGMTNITVVMQYLFTCLAVPVLRKKGLGSGKRDRFVIPGGPVIPILGALGSLFLLYGADWKEALFGVGALIVGVLVAFLSKGR
jgi:amino acid transporter